MAKRPLDSGTAFVVCGIVLPLGESKVETARESTGYVRLGSVLVVCCVSVEDIPLSMNSGREFVHFLMYLGLVP
jgi:hypothetical protein